MTWTDHWRTFTSEDCARLTHTRDGELKLGQRVSWADQGLLESLEASDARYVLIGLPEDVGVRANGGRPGAASAWEVSLPHFLNVQSNEYLDGAQVLVLGALRADEWPAEAESASLPRLREMTAEIDQAVWPLIERIAALGKTALVIGGGHNNSYGCLRGVSQAIGRPVHCVNIDPHADYRSLEGRHSGNGFRYAREEGYLDRYAVFGLHEGYNSAEMLSLMKEPSRTWYKTFEHLSFGHLPYIDHWDEIWTRFGREKVGLEIDMDGITKFPSSADTPSGWSLNEVRQMIVALGHLKAHVPYLHIAEAAPSLVPSSGRTVGRALALLLCDFIKSGAGRY